MTSYVGSETSLTKANVVHTVRYQRVLPLRHRKKTLNNANTFAENYISISKEDIRIIKHCRKSLLFYENEAWKKKYTNTIFDVTMGSYDGAEVCELIGMYIQSLLTNILSKDNMGLYRNDGLFILS